MKKYILLVLIASLLLTGCQKADTVNETTPETSTVEVSKESTEAIEGLTYTNEEYGFELEFPKSWEGYTVTKRDVAFLGEDNLVKTLDFGFKEQESIFNVAVFTTAQWAQIESEEGPVPAKFGENDKYSFAFTPTQNTVSPAMDEKRYDILTIIQSFKAI